jgi:hypothetical protein
MSGLAFVFDTTRLQPSGLAVAGAAPALFGHHGSRLGQGQEAKLGGELVGGEVCVGLVGSE